MNDQLGASDCWLMFSLWCAANGHMAVAFIAIVLCSLYCFMPDKVSA